MNKTARETQVTSPTKTAGDWDQTAVVREHFKDASAEWGARYGGAARRMSDLDLSLRREAVHRFLRPMTAASERTLRVIDVGCGSGDVLDGFPRDSVRVTGIDLVPEMVAAAAKTHPADRFCVGSVEHLPFAPQSADVVTCLGVLEYLPEPAAALEAIFRMLRPGGHIIISFPNRTSGFRALTRIEVPVERALLRGLAWVWRRHRGPDADPKYHHRSWSSSEAKTLLADAGFANVGLCLHTFGLWGIVGRHPISLRLSTWLSRRFDRESAISRNLACTIVARAERPATNSDGQTARDVGVRGSDGR